MLFIALGVEPGQRHPPGPDGRQRQLFPHIRNRLGSDVPGAIVQLVEMVVEKFSPSLYNALGIFLPLIAVNCAILGVALFVQEREYTTISEVTVYAVGSGLGWFLAIATLAAIREKITYSNIPKPLRGLGISFILTGLMAIAFMSFMGIKI